MPYVVIRYITKHMYILIQINFINAINPSPGHGWWLLSEVSRFFFCYAQTTNIILYTSVFIYNLFSLITKIVIITRVLLHMIAIHKRKSKPLCPLILRGNLFMVVFSSCLVYWYICRKVVWIMQKEG